MTKIMTNYTQQYNAAQQTSSKFDESAADLTSFLDFSSFDPAATATGHDLNSIALPPLEVPPTGTFDNAFVYSNRSPLRPVDDSLLDSPLGLELSPADSIFTTSSVSGSPYDLDMSIADFGDSSPLFSTSSYDGSPAVAAELAFPSFPHPSSNAGTPGMITTAELPSLFAALPLVAAHELADIKPMSLPGFAPPPPPPHHHQVLGRNESTDSVPFSFDDFIGDGTSALAQTQEEEVIVGADESQQVVEPPASSSSRLTPALGSSSEPPSASASSAAAAAAAKRKSLAEIKREAALKVAEKEFSQDKHLGFRNTKKKMVDYDAPTLPKNYLTESATSKKRSGSTKVAASVQAAAAKRARTSSSSASSSSSSTSPSSATAAARSASPAVALPALPATQPTPLDADQLDEEQLSQIELKRRQNTLAARKSRMRKAETFKMLSDEVEKLKQLNEALMRENRELKARLGEQ